MEVGANSEGPAQAEFESLLPLQMIAVGGYNKKLSQMTNVHIQAVLPTIISILQDEDSM
eukprot:COSAG05_NODE_23794_length_255_cov_1.294872_1_plen_58_part_01